VHGANRLASNSLLEGMVFGARVAEALVSGRTGPEPTGVMSELLQATSTIAVGAASGVAPRYPSDHTAQGEVPCTWIEQSEENPTNRTMLDVAGRSEVSADSVASGDDDLVKSRALLQRSMTEGAGVTRSATSLRSAARVVSAVRAHLSRCDVDRASAELANICEVSSALLIAAELREETRGAHSRREYPESRPEWKRRLVHGRR